MKRAKIFFINTIIITFSSFLLRIVGMLFNIYVSNQVGKEALGVFGLVMSVYSFGITIAVSGINLATIRIISEKLALGNEIGVKKAAQKCLGFSIFFGVLSSIIFLINKDFIVNVCLNGKIEYSIIYLICIALPAIAICSFMNGYFIAVRRTYKNAISQFVEQFTKIIFTILLLKFLWPLSISSAIFALILGDVISEIVACAFNYTLYLYDRRRYIDINKDSNSGNVKQVLRIAMPVAFASYIKSGLSSVKQLIIPSRLQKSGVNYNHAIGVYGSITGMAMPIIMFPGLVVSSFANLLIPEFSRYYVKEDYKRIKQVSKYILSFAFVFSLIITGVLFILGDKIGMLVYNDIEVGMYIKILSPLSIFIYLDMIIDCILKGLDHQVGIMIVNIIDLVTTIGIIYFLVPLVGINGFIISMYVSEILNFIISLWQLARKCSHKKTSVKSV